MRRIAVTVLAAAIAAIGLTTEAYAESQSTNDGRNPNYAGDNYYGYYGGGTMAAITAIVATGAAIGPVTVVRNGYYRGDGCMRRRFDAYGNVYYKVRRACRW